VTRILTGADGRASGVEYVDATGALREQQARAVILCGYTFENVRLLLLSGDGRRPDGLGNNRGQVGKHLITKMWMDVYGECPGTVFNGHTGPSGQMWSLDDFISAGFDCVAHGFVGGATPNVENQRLPIQIARELLPPDVPSWGAGYKAHIRKWQQFAAVRIQPDALSYDVNFMDLDPHHRDRSGIGLPVVGVTYDQQPNERRMLAFFAEQGKAILREMGATKTWAGPSFGGLISSHDLGGARMGEDPAASVVGPDLQVHDTPGLYVYGTAVFPSCHGVNPTLTMWALIYRAVEGLAERLRRG
jgi:gluconate 2-dehydrogenase alpha chain